MTDLSAEYQALAQYRPTHKVRFVTAASLFDGHDAAINIMRRILQSMGVEVIHLGHNRSVDEIVTAALQEDVQGIAVSSYQGGHVEYFKYMIDLLRRRGGDAIQVFGGGGGVIVPSEIRELQDYGVTRIYSPEDGQRMGLQGMIGEMLMRCDADLSVHAPPDVSALQGHTDAAWRALSQAITALENGKASPALKAALHEAAALAASRRALAQLLTALENGTPPAGLDEAGFAALRQDLHRRADTVRTPALGITGTGGAGQSSLTDEQVRRFRRDQDDRLR
ncbi:MAG: cobalamin-dependent protein, partial [Rubrivivax sp.]